MAVPQNVMDFIQALKQQDGASATPQLSVSQETPSCHAMNDALQQTLTEISYETFAKNYHPITKTMGGGTNYLDDWTITDPQTHDQFTLKVQEVHGLLDVGPTDDSGSVKPYPRAAQLLDILRDRLPPARSEAMDGSAPAAEHDFNYRELTSADLQPVFAAMIADAHDNACPAPTPVSTVANKAGGREPGA